MPPRKAAAVLTTLVLACVLAACGSSSAQPHAAGPGGPFAVGKLTTTFVDANRSTPALGKFPGAPTRTLPTIVLYPASGAAGGKDETNAAPDRKYGPYPLVVFAHGNGSNGSEMEHIVRDWVAHGYVVALPTFPVSRKPYGEFQDYTDQPGDVSFVITKMLELSAIRRSRISGVIDPSRIAVGGHSLGAITALSVSNNTCCRDARIKAVISVSGIELPYPGGKYEYTNPPTFLAIHGTADKTVPYVDGHISYEHAVAPKFFLTLRGAPHGVFVDPWMPVIDRTVQHFLDANFSPSPAVRAAALRGLPRDGNRAGVATLTVTLRSPVSTAHP
jgi:dienelactone hydrolase